MHCKIFPPKLVVFMRILIPLRFYGSAIFGETLNAAIEILVAESPFDCTWLIIRYEKEAVLLTA
jgi:hypothetical protein